MVSFLLAFPPKPNNYSSYPHECYMPAHLSPLYLIIVIIFRKSASYEASPYAVLSNFLSFYPSSVEILSSVSCYGIDSLVKYEFLKGPWN
jgi:hypothetical protein